MCYCVFCKSVGLSQCVGMSVNVLLCVMYKVSGAVGMCRSVSKCVIVCSPSQWDCRNVLECQQMCYCVFCKSVGLWQCVGVPANVLLCVPYFGQVYNTSLKSSAQ